MSPVCPKTKGPCGQRRWNRIMSEVREVVWRLLLKKRGRIEESPQQDKRHTSFWKKLFGGGKKPGTAFNTGCLSCGSERKLAMVSLQELNKDSHFSGTLLLCSSCGRIFCDSSVILEDQRTLQPLRTLVEGSMQHHHVSLPRVAFVSANPFPPRTTIYQCILGRPFHSEVGMEFIESILLFWIPFRHAQAPQDYRASFNRD